MELAVAATDGYQVALGLCHTGGDGPDTALRDEFDAHLGLRIHILEVKNQLGQVFD